MPAVGITDLVTAGEIGEVIEEGTNSETKDSLVSDAVVEKKEKCNAAAAKDTLIFAVDNILKKLDDIKNTVDIVVLSMTTISTTLKMQNEKKYEEIINTLDGLTMYGASVSENIPKMKVKIKKIRTKIKIAKNSDDLLGVNDDIVNAIGKINEYAKTFDLDPRFMQNYLGAEVTPIIELLKKYFTSSIHMLEKLSDQLEKYIEILAE